jgi:hypothetical protein
LTVPGFEKLAHGLLDEAPLVWCLIGSDVIDTTSNRSILSFLPILRIAWCVERFGFGRKKCGPSEEAHHDVDGLNVIQVRPLRHFPLASYLVNDIRCLYPLLK